MARLTRLRLVNIGHSSARSEDEAIVAAEWELEAGPMFGGTGATRLLTGVFYQWRQTTPPELQRLYFAGYQSPDVPELSVQGLPFSRITADGQRRRLGLKEFRERLDLLKAGHPHLQIFKEDNERQWAEYLENARLDPEPFKYQVQMNLREGSADELFRFDEGAEFVDFLLELALDDRLGDAVSRNLSTFRSELKARKDLWLPEKALLQGLSGKLEPLQSVSTERMTLATRATDAATSARGSDRGGPRLCRHSGRSDR